eukprot:TRINITY_DN97921_c0_g1_i1.p1 TRINITY_DN97921_c0_g1~~TRINITY_DN97921_c0_g1_i1.p1  ORF type:complete len:343 (-),score=73.93 TRINITY_DN97921_c0_g1_i1:78-1106(-)
MADGVSVQWEVVGGAEKGGLVVRQGPQLTSEQLEQRLSTGSLVEQLELKGERLHFRRLSGTGPDVGWISTKLKDKALAVCKKACPVLVCFYSGGMTSGQGRGHLQAFLDAARVAGLQTQVVLDHATEEAYRDCHDWTSYVNQLQQQVETVELKDRPLLIFAHSHGCLEAYGLAKRLGKRVLKLYVVARRPPSQALLDEVWGVSSGPEIQKLADTELLEGLLSAWRNSYLESFRNQSPLPPPAQKIIATVRAQYSSPCAPGGSAELATVLGSDAEAAVPAPIAAIACAKELAKGETSSKMEGWRSLTTGSFSLQTVDADHMDCLTAESELISLVLEDMKALFL